MGNDLPPLSRKPRADAQRNRDQILNAAKAIMSDKGSAASMEEIAEAAGVGNGTLYRHFPTRTALVEAVCREDTRNLVEAAATLGSTREPLDALQAWMEMFIDYIGTKRNVAEATGALASPSPASSGEDVRAALQTLYARAAERCESMTKFDPLDLMRAVAGVGSVEPREDWQLGARRLVSAFVLALRSGVA